MTRLGNLWMGAWVQGDGPPTPLVHPVSGETVAEACTTGIDRAAGLAYARDVAGPALRATSFAERAARLEGMARTIHAHRDALLALSTATYGATRADAKFDVDGASGTLAWYAVRGRTLGDRHVMLDGEAEPVGRSARFVGQHLALPRPGVAIHINAFNFPAWGMAEKLATALLAGMPCVVKPATATAAVTHRIVALWHEAGLLDDGAVQLLCGGAGDLLDHVGPMDVIAFTGSSDTAAHIRRHPAVVRSGVRLNVEADSLNAAVLAPDVDPDSPTFEMFLGDVVRDLTQKAGQKCTAIRRVLVPERLVEDVADGLEDLLSQCPMGDPEDRATRVAPLSTPDQARDVAEGLRILGEAHEVLVQGPGEPPGPGYVRPTVLFSREGLQAEGVHDREVFGPVATVLSYDGTVAAASALVAAGGGGLVTSIYTDDRPWGREAIVAMAPWHGRIQWGSRKIATQGMGPGTVLPAFVHGGPGQAGGGQELGGLRGLALYQQLTAVQGDRVLLEAAFGAPSGEG